MLNPEMHALIRERDLQMSKGSGSYLLIQVDYELHSTAGHIYIKSPFCLVNRVDLSINTSCCAFLQFHRSLDGIRGNRGAELGAYARLHAV